MEGWIKLHRYLLKKPIWFESTDAQKVILITLLLMANHEERNWEFRGMLYKIKPGQFVTSLRSIARNAGVDVTIQNVRTALSRFEMYEFLTNESTNKNRLITIVNWELYQAYDAPPNKETNKEINKQLTGNQQADNKQLTGNQQATNRQLTTNKKERNKEIKNERNKDKHTYAEYVQLTEEEHESLIHRFGAEVTNLCIEELDNYKGSTGKTYASDYRTILNWVVDKVTKANRQPNPQKPFSYPSKSFTTPSYPPNKPKMVMTTSDPNGSDGRLNSEEMEELRAMVRKLDESKKPPLS